MTKYRINGGNWCIYEGPFTLDGFCDGENVIEYYSVDNVNNEEEVKSITLTLDSKAPAINLVSPDHGSIGVCQIFRSSALPVMGSISDERLLRYKVEYTSGISLSDESGFVTIKESAVSENFYNGVLCYWDTLSMMVSGYYTLRIKAEDKLENVATLDLKLYIGEPELKYTYKYEDAKLWGNHRFEPAYIALDSEGNSYVSEHSLGRIIKFNSTGTVTAVFGGPPPGGIFNKEKSEKWKGEWHGRVHLVIPDGIALDKEDNLWVADRLNHRVVKLDQDGNLVLQIGGEGFGHWDRNRSCWNGWFKKEGGYFHKEKTFNWPTGIVIDSQSNIWVADRFNNRLQRFTPEGELLEEDTIETGVYKIGKNYSHWEEHYNWWAKREFYAPGGIAIDKEDNIYVADQIGKRVLKIDSKERKLKLEIREGIPKPDGIVVSQSGYVYVTDQMNKEVKKYDKYGNLVMSWGNDYDSMRHYRRWVDVTDEFDVPGGVAINVQYGAVHVVDRTNNKICVYVLPPISDIFMVKKIITDTTSTAVKKTSGPSPDFVKGDIYTYPNPARDGQNVTFHIETGIADSIEISIYNIAGELVYSASIADFPTVKNNRYCYEHRWGCVNQNGEKLASGVYIYVIRARKQQENEIKHIGKVAVIR